MSRYETSNTQELMSSPLAIKCFQHLGCFEFCELVQKVQYHLELTILFVTNLKKGQVTIVGVTFTMSTDIIEATTWIPKMGEKWFKTQELDAQLYQPYLKAPYKDIIKKIFPFGQLLDRFSPLMKIIMNYFTCEDRFFRLYNYHIRRLMHFTRVNLLNIPHYLYRSLDKMAYKVELRNIELHHPLSSLSHQDHFPSSS